MRLSDDLKIKRFSATEHTHTREHEFKAHTVTDCSDKALRRCTFCVVKNNSQAAAAHRALQNAAATPEDKSSVLMSSVHGSTGEKKRDVRYCELGCFLETRASRTGAEATMCTVNMAEEPDWLLCMSGSVEWVLTAERMTEGERERSRAAQAGWKHAASCRNTRRNTVFMRLLSVYSTHIFMEQ